jgi:hypothetical protein
VDRYEAILKEKITIMYDMMAQTVLSGAGNMEEYKYSLGYLHALLAVVKEMETVSEDMRK